MATTLHQTSSLVEKDHAYIWHPFTQMQTARPPIPIVRAKGAYLYAEDGSRYLDAISSWWVNLHGHVCAIESNFCKKWLNAIESEAGVK